MRVPSKSKNAPVVGPPGLRSTSSTSVSTTASGRYRIARSGPSATRRRLDGISRRAPTPKRWRSVADSSQIATFWWDRERRSVDERDRALGAVGHRELRLVEQLGRHVVEQRDAVAFVVGFEHLGGEDVAAAVTGAGFGVDAEFHGRELPPTARLTNCCGAGLLVGSPRWSPDRSPDRRRSTSTPTRSTRGSVTASPA